MKKIYLFAPLTIIIISAALVVFAANNACKSAIADFDKTPNLSSIITKLDGLTTNIANLSTSIANMETQTLSLEQKFVANNSVKYYISSIDTALNKLNSLVKKSGLESLGTNMMLDQNILASLAEKRAQQNIITAYQVKMQELKEDQEAADLQSYGDAFVKLTEASTKRIESEKNRRRRRNNEKRKATPEEIAAQKSRANATADIIIQFPYSFATGKLLANKAIAAARSEDLSGAQKYYDTLSKNNLSSTVTDREEAAGIYVEANLANAYIKAAKKAKSDQDKAHFEAAAMNLIYQIEANYDDMISWDTGNRNGRSKKSGQEISHSLRQKLTE